MSCFEPSARKVISALTARALGTGQICFESRASVSTGGRRKRRGEGEMYLDVSVASFPAQATDFEREHAGAVRCITIAQGGLVLFDFGDDRNSHVGRDGEESRVVSNLRSESK
jgi:hypothetical protein